MKLVLIGGGGHARVVADVAASAGFNLLGVLTPGEAAPGLQRLGDDDWLDEAPRDIAVHVAFGPVPGKPARQALYERFRALGFALPAIVSRDATVSGLAMIDGGALIVHGAIINAGVQIGPNAIVNSGAIIDHDSIVGGQSHVAPGAVIAGGATIGDGCLVGAGATILPGVSIAHGVVIGAGAVVTRSITEPNSIWVGNPARRQG